MRILFLIIWIIGITPAATAQSPHVCPGPIAFIGNGLHNPALLRIYAEAYQAVGCVLNFDYLPARRGVFAFNNGDVDGEGLRVAATETKYTRDFIKVEPALFTIENIMWGEAEAQDSDIDNIGYLLGVIWQERYVQETNQTFTRFYEIDEMIEAYNKQFISAFLGSSFSMKNAFEENHFQKPPARLLILQEQNVYHYLSTDFADFAAAFSAHLIKHKPFAPFDQIKTQ